MKSRKQVLMAGLVLAAAASAFGAQAADQSAYFDQQRQISDGYSPQSVVTHSATTGRERSANTESAQFEWFENQLSQGTVPNITPSERGAPVAQTPKPESAKYEAFENQLSVGTVANFTPSERAGAAE